MRRYIQPSSWLLSLLLALAIGDCAAAQSTPGVNTDDASNGIELVQPDTYILEDEDGNLQTVLNFSYQAFVEARRILQGIERPQQPPAYTIREIHLRGTQRSEYFELQAEFDIDLQSSKWVRVPLSMRNAALASDVGYEGGGKLVLSYEEESGYVGWLRTTSEDKPDQTDDEVPQQPSIAHRISLELHLPIAKQGDESQIELSLPRAVKSDFQFDVPLTNAVGHVTSPAQIVATKPASDATTRFEGIGASGIFRLAWRPDDRQEARLPRALEASGEILVIVNGPHVRSEAKLLVRSFGEQFDRFQVRLPPGAALVESSQAGYAITSIEDAATHPEALERGLVVEVALDSAASESPAVRLTTERTINTDKKEEFVELAGFEVIDAVRQWGYVASQVRDDWQLLWGDWRNVGRVEELPATLQRDDSDDAFEYFSQPFSLPARVIPKTTRVRVRPEYVVSVSSQQARLQGTLNYSIRGAKLYEFRIRIPDWRDVEIGPPEVIDKDRIVELENRTYLVPLKRPSTEAHELKITATLAVDTEKQDAVEFQLPQPEATFHESAVLVVQPEDNVEINVDQARSSGLAPRHVAPNVTLPVRQQEPLYFRVEGESPAFVAQLTIHQQQVRVDMVNRLSLLNAETTVEQQVSYAVRYLPLDRLDFLAPSALANTEIYAQLGGKQIPIQTVEAPQENAVQGDIVPMRVTLPATARIGELNLLLRFKLERRPLQAGRSELWEVPLIMPIGGELISNRLHIDSDRTLQTSINSPGEEAIWKPMVSESTGHGGSDYVAPGRAFSVPLALQLEPAEGSGVTQIREMWLQAWLTDSARQDRVLMLLETSEPQLHIVMPERVRAQDTEVRLDGLLQPSRPSSDGSLLVELAKDGVRRERQLELRYQFQDRETSAHVFAAPKLQNSQWLGVAYWHFVTPLREHILGTPADLSAQYEWQWRGFYLGQRTPAQPQDVKVWAES
ncbi:MAG: hypothetical protein KDA42_11790, partial [Planctomycetales bacterium]|nr:hypothetical protein [Planctomycetales bacterium]